MRRLTPVRIALLALFVVLLAARLGLHPNTPYKSFLLSLAPVMAAWRFGALPDWLAPLPMTGTIPALIGVWLVLLLVVALLTGALNSYLRPAPMTILGAAAVIYALASGFLPLPLGAPVMTAGMLWLALWQGIFLYRVKLS